MKKLLLAFDGEHFSNGAFDFACRLNEREPLMLTGVFLPQLDFANLWSYAEGTAGTLFVPLVEKDSAVKIEHNIARFEALCRKHHIEYRIHKDFNDFALPELKKETRFADLLLLGSESFYAATGVKEQNEYMKEMLHIAECPVLLVPEKAAFPQSNILTYDGSESSAYAIRQFSYLFPELAPNESVLLYARHEADMEIPDVKNIEELVSQHFPKLSIMKLTLDPKIFLSAWLMDIKNPVLVAGAFGRSGISRLFKPSFVTDLIKEHSLPVFIAHH